MTIIPQPLLNWHHEIDQLGDLTRLQIVLGTIPDQALIRKIERKRGRGRNDYPARAMWNLLIAGYIFGHSSIASLLRELNRNKQLAYLCGFGLSKLPSEYNMSRFMTILLKYEAEVRNIFEELSQTLYGLLEGFGRELAIDSKWLPSAANHPSKRKKTDGRSETEARKGVKTYSGVRDDGSQWEKVMSCFGYKVHLVVDAEYEVPVAYKVTDAAASDITVGKKMIEELKDSRPDILETCEHLMGDRGYDSKAFIKTLTYHGIKAVIAKRTMWRAETEKQLPGYEDAYYDEAGNVYCYTKNKGIRNKMVPNGYEKERDAVRFKCPAQAYGISCSEKETCQCRNIRIPLSTDPRIFTQVQRASYKWDRLYNMRTSVERVNSRLDGAYGFEERRTRGLARTELHVGLALLVMLAMAVWKVRHAQRESLRSLFKVA